MISIDIKNNTIDISGDIKQINRDARLLLSSQFKIVFDSNDKIQYEFNCNKEEAIKILEEGLRYCNVNFEFSKKIIKEQEEYFNQEQAFRNFSEKAKKIRNNDCEVNEFKKFKEILEEKMPSRKLYGLQFLSSYHLAFAQNACNFSVPGAGKTTIVYGAYAYLKNLPENDLKHISKILVIGPLNSFGPWEEEYKNCFGREVQSKRIVGMSKEQRKRYFQGINHAELTLISYSTAAYSVEDIVTFLKNEKRKVMVVLDEAHKIKNISEEAQIAPAILKLAKYSNSRVVLTGTPAPNGYLDLYNLYKFIWPDKRIIQFSKGQLNRMSREKINISEKNMVAKLIDDISPFFIRIKKNDFDCMPEPIENELIKVKMDENQATIYSYIEKNLLKNIDNSVDVSSFTKAKILRMMQAATNPSLLKKPIYDIVGADIKISDAEILNKIKNYNRIPNKFIECVNLTKKILKNKEEKIVIWAYFIDNLFLIKKLLDRENIKSELLYGATPVDSDFNENELMTREKIVREFNNKKSELRVIIANPYAASESISLHKVCHNAIYIERNFNAATFIQSKDRIHRYGLKKDDRINYYYLGSSNTIDETVDKRLKFKERRMKDLIESEEIPLFSNYFEMDIESNDIKELLKDYVNRKN